MVRRTRRNPPAVVALAPEAQLGIYRVYLACGATDLRKSIDGLAVLVKEEFELDPFSL